MGMIDRDRLERIAVDYQTGDASAELNRADYDDSSVAEPMVTTSLRLPKPVMDAVRAAAEARGSCCALARSTRSPTAAKLARPSRRLLPAPVRPAP